jgi:bacterioferritin (cytochrome b1)
MTKDQMIELLNSDLRNEYMHMHFYLHSASIITGLHRAELREFLTEEAANEMKHVQEFADLIVGLGGNPTTIPAPFPDNIKDPTDILSHALMMEDTVVNNYATRMGQAEELGGTDGRWIEAFLENQIVNSRSDADNIRQMLGK